MHRHGLVCLKKLRGRGGEWNDAAPPPKSRSRTSRPWPRARPRRCYRPSPSHRRPSRGPGPCRPSPERRRRPRRRAPSSAQPSRRLTTSRIPRLRERFPTSRTPILRERFRRLQYIYIYIYIYIFFESSIAMSQITNCGMPAWVVRNAPRWWKGLAPPPA